MTKTNVSIGKMTHSFASYPVDLPKRSGFDRSNSLFTCLDSGYIIPIYQDLMYPGETLKMKMANFCRLSAQIVPFMSNVYMDFHLWAVPYRLVWKHWPNLMGERTSKNQDTDYLTPQISAGSTGVEFGSLSDYLGVRPGIPNIEFNSHWHRAYNLIYNEWYRDENLQDEEIPFTNEDSGDSISDYVLRRRGKRKDYFTGALPFTQKGQAVDLPLLGTAPVVGNGKGLGLAADNNVYGYMFENASSGGTLATTISTASWSSQGPLNIGSSVSYDTSHSFANNKVLGVSTNPEYSGLVADLTEASGLSVLQFYEVMAIQNVLQADARGGTRYIEMILNHFGIQSSDKRLQRPEFIGGGTFELDLSVVPQTSSTDSTSPQGTLASYGIVQGTTKDMIYTSEEHTILLGVVSIRTPYIYQYGMDRNFFRRSRFDYYLPALDNLGEQAIYNRELFITGDQGDQEVYGYNEAWADLRYKQSRVSSHLRSDAPQSLDYWHLAQKYNSVPALNSEWIQEKPPIDRVLAVRPDEESRVEGIVSNTPQFIANFYFDEQWYRPMGVYSIPGLQGIRV